MKEKRFIPAKCPNCGGAVKLSRDGKHAFCPYCKTDIVVEEITGKSGEKVATKDVENLLKLADDFFDMGNFEESFNYYGRVLELDARSWRAWLGRGRAMWWMPRDDYFFIDEMFDNFGKAEEYAPEDMKDEVKEKGYSHTVEVMNDITGEYFLVDQPFYIYNRRLPFALNMLYAIHLRYPEDVEILKRLVDLCAYEIIRIRKSYRNYVDADGLIEKINVDRDKYVKKLAKLDPTFVPAETVETKTDDSRKSFRTLTCLAIAVFVSIGVFILFVKGCIYFLG